MPLELSLTNEHKIPVTVHPVTPGGQPATLDGPVVFTVESGECTIEPIDDLSAYIVSGMNPGDSVVMVTADADLGAGIQHVQDTALVHVSHAMAANLGLSAGEPELK